MAKAKAKSPYNRYNKKPYRYSQLYHDWRAARNDNKDAQARELGLRHSKYWLGLPIPQDNADAATSSNEKEAA